MDRKRIETALGTLVVLAGLSFIAAAYNTADLQRTRGVLEVPEVGVDHRTRFRRLRQRQEGQGPREQYCASHAEILHGRSMTTFETLIDLH